MALEKEEKYKTKPYLQGDSRRNLLPIKRKRTKKKSDWDGKRGIVL